MVRICQVHNLFVVHRIILEALRTMLILRVKSGCGSQDQNIVQTLIIIPPTSCSSSEIVVD